MVAEFPDDYPRYRRHVPQLIPGLRLIGARKVLAPPVAANSVRAGDR
jgi:hypothetical protein